MHRHSPVAKAAAIVAIGALTATQLLPAILFWLFRSVCYTIAVADAADVGCRAVAGFGVRTVVAASSFDSSW